MSLHMSDFDQEVALRDRRRAAYTARRRRIAAARTQGTHTDDQWYAICVVVGWRCVRCLAHHPEGLTKDHIKPLWLGGSDGVDNIQPLCRHCNSTKGDEDVNWIQRRLLEGQ